MPLYELIVYISAATVGVFILFDIGGLLEFISNPIRAKFEFNEWSQKPLKPIFNCVGCMASIWGSSFYLLATLIGSFRPFSFTEMLFTLLCCIPLNFIIERLTNSK